MLKHLVLAGSGLNGFAYVGVLRELERRRLMESITHFAGASSGSFISTMLAIGVRSVELEQILLHVGLDDLVKTNPFRQVYNLFSSYGLHPRKRMKTKLESLFEDRNIPKDITFEELYQKTEKTLCIVVTNVKERTSLYFTHKRTPAYKVVDALVSSISVPLLFTFDKSTNLVDGGVTDNYPLWFFNGTGEESLEERRNLPISPSTMGVCIKAEHEIYPTTFTGYIASLFLTSLYQLGEVVRSEGYDKQTLSIEGLYASLNFNLTTSQMESLIKHGQKSAKEFLDTLL